MTKNLSLALACALLPASAAQAQEHDHAAMNHANMDMPNTEETAQICVTSLSIPARSDGSGTARLPGNEGTMGGGCTGPASPHRGGGLHLMAGDWMLMAHGYAAVQYTDHSGPRGDDQVYAPSMLMITGEKSTHWGRVLLKTMTSLEPAMKPRGYPNLFATGETAGGRPLIDRQHPHDLFMELAARIDLNIAPGTTAFLYGGPVGEPALGPSAFMMRGSAELNPEPPITHHWFDSTHITYGVVTAGLSSTRWQIEASAFRGAEPDEERWGIEAPRLDSWAVRATWTPSSKWAVQASYGQIHQPEALHPGENERRFTASAHYSNRRGLSAMLAFSNKDRVPASGADGNSLTAWLAEASWNVDRHNTLFGRIENVANDELFPDHANPLHDVTFRLSKFQVGYARRIPLGPLELALGGSASAYAKPRALDAAYGRRAIGYTLFARFSLGS